MFRLWATIPANTTATIHVSFFNSSAITENDLPLVQPESVELLRLGDGEAVVAEVSGRYEFVGSVR